MGRKGGERTSHVNVLSQINQFKELKSENNGLRSRQGVKFFNIALNVIYSVTYYLELQRAMSLYC